MQMDIFYSYACRDSYLVFAWLKLVEKSGQAININWYPFAIQMEDSQTYWNQSWETANSELRGFIAGESAKRQEEAAFYRFHNALEQAVHEDLLELGDEATLIRAGQQAGLDMNRFVADWQDTQLAQFAHDSHKQGIEKFNISGTPTLVFSNGLSFHLELSKTPLQADALATFNAITMLTTTHPYIKQLRQTN
ncbi:MAG: DsbA family protein [Anaerolineales bacterium]|nr:DsbA family protein [Anaerolineales bacterium]